MANSDIHPSRTVLIADGLATATNMSEQKADYPYYQGRIPPSSSLCAYKAKFLPVDCHPAAFHSRHNN